jgi:1-acyl-sn-glycerol-3-phosphate acyltransferase
MSITYTIVTYSIKRLTRILCNIDDHELINVPEQGPLIIVSNHVNFLDAPVVYTHLQPRKITGFVKAETWENPVMGFLFDLWDGIPLQRGEADTTAFRLALEALGQGKILAIAPEGTRSEDGKLRRGLPGMVLLAQRSGTPIIPVVYYGGEKFKNNMNQLKRTDFYIRVGKIFKLQSVDGKMNRELRQIIVDEIMYQLALLLPPAYRGYYTDVSKVTTDYLDFV